MIEKHRKAGSTMPVTDGMLEFTEILKEQLKDQKVMKQASIGFGSGLRKIKSVCPRITGQRT